MAFLLSSAASLERREAALTTRCVGCTVKSCLISFIPALVARAEGMVEALLLGGATPTFPTLATDLHCKGTILGDRHRPACKLRTLGL